MRDVSDLTNDYVPLELNVASKLFENDSVSKYYTENNEDFLRMSKNILQTIKLNSIKVFPA